MNGAAVVLFIIARHRTMKISRPVAQFMVPLWTEERLLETEWKREQ